MTKDIETIAKRIKMQLEFFRKPENSNIRGEAIETLACQIADDLAFSNPEFSSLEFLKACGIKV